MAWEGEGEQNVIEKYRRAEQSCASAEEISKKKIDKVEY
jgi:hypothetical protein